MKPKLIRVTTVPISMNILLKNQLSFMAEYFVVIGVSSKDEKHFPEVRQREGIRMEAIELTRKISPLKDLLALWKMYRLFLREKPDIVHSHTPKAGLVAMIAALLAAVPTRLHTLAGMPLMEANGFHKFILTITEKITYACAHKVYPNSLGLKNFVLSNKMCSPSKLKVIGNGSSNGIDTGYFSPENDFMKPGLKNEVRQKYNVEKDDIVFCFVGRVVNDKGIRELVQAFSKLVNHENSTCKLVLVGPLGIGKDSLDAVTENIINSNTQIRFVGRHDDIRPFLFMSDIFVFPSYREGFPNVVLQAGAMGLPSIVTDINGSNEIIIHGQNGLIVPVKDADRLLDAMNLLSKDIELRKNLASNARSMIVNRYNQQALWSELLLEYNSMLINKESEN
jgi:glycosyltransferase involved in cell wall biosynthesis